MAKKKKKAKKNEFMIKKSLVQEYIRGKGLRVSAESLEVLSDLVLDLCDEAIERAESNRRKTIQKQDF
ncbi:MAG: hypothetical protein AAF443_04280 [Chlamydiota bacterium]